MLIQGDIKGTEAVEQSKTGHIMIQNEIEKAGGLAATIIGQNLQIKW